MKKNTHFLITIIIGFIILLQLLLFGCSSITTKQEPPAQGSTTQTVNSNTQTTTKQVKQKIPKGCSPYTQAALMNRVNPYIKKGYESISNNTPLSKQVLIPKLVANVLTCDYYAYLDYTNGIITQTQFFQCIQNTQGSIAFLSQNFFTINTLVMSYPQKNSSIGLSYFETIGSQKNWNSVNSVQTQEKLILLANSIYSTRSPQQMFQLISQYGVLLAQAKLYGTNNNADVSQITLNTFQLSWLIDNAYYTKSFVYAIIK